MFADVSFANINLQYTGENMKNQSVIDDSVTSITCISPPSFKDAHKAYFEKRDFSEITCDECGKTQPRSEMRYHQGGWFCFEHHNVCNICASTFLLDGLTVIPNQFGPIKVCKSCLGATRGMR